MNTKCEGREEQVVIPNRHSQDCYYSKVSKMPDISAYRLLIQFDSNATMTISMMAKHAAITGIRKLLQNLLVLISC